MRETVETTLRESQRKRQDRETAVRVFRPVGSRESSRSAGPSASQV